MTIEEFRARINSGPTAEQLNTEFEKRITTIANNAIDKREDFAKLKKQVSDFETRLETVEEALNLKQQNNTGDVE